MIFRRFQEMIYKYFVLPSALFDLELAKRQLKRLEKELESIKKLNL